MLVGFSKMKKRIWLLAALLGLTAAACNEKPKLSIEPAGPIELSLGDSVQLSAESPDVRWSIVGPPERGNISAGGFYQSPDQLPTDPKVLVQAQLGSDTAVVEVHLVE